MGRKRHHLSWRSEWLQGGGGRRVASGLEGRENSQELGVQQGWGGRGWRQGALDGLFPALNLSS